MCTLTALKQSWHPQGRSAPFFCGKLSDFPALPLSIHTRHLVDLIPNLHEYFRLIIYAQFLKKLVVNWSEPAKREYASHGGLVDQNNVRSFGVSWNGICGYLYGFRIKPMEIPFSSSSPTIVNLSDKEPWTVLAFLNKFFV